MSRTMSYSLSRGSSKKRLVEPKLYHNRVDLLTGGGGSLERRTITDLRGLLKSPMRRSASCLPTAHVLSRSSQSISNHDSWYAERERQISLTKDHTGFGFVVVSRLEDGAYFHRVGCVIQNSPASRVDFRINDEIVHLNGKLLRKEFGV